MPGTFKLLPPRQSQLVELERDYDDMQPMLFGDPPAFKEIIVILTQLESQINGIA